MHLPDEPLVSFITLSYNLERYIGDTIESVLGQDYKRIEYVVIDDGSSDNSVELIKKYSDTRLRLIKLDKNVGACAAYGRAYAELTGDLVCSVDADDIALKPKTSRQIEFLKSNPDYDLVTSYIEAIDSAGRRMPQPNLSEEWVNQSRNLSDIGNWLSQNYVAHSAVMITKRAHDDVGVLDGSMSASPDYDHFLRFLAKGYRFGCVAEPLLRYRLHDSNATHKHPDRTFSEQIYSFWRNLLPLLIDDRRLTEIADRLRSLCDDPQYAKLALSERMRLLAVLATEPLGVSSFAEFKLRWAQQPALPGFVLESVLEYSAGRRNELDLLDGLRLQEAGIAWWRQQTEYRQQLADHYRDELVALKSASHLQGAS
jgi:glycosyltransferase involved in cell wall biosynthesis